MRNFIVILISALAILSGFKAFSCTNLIVTKGASKDGSAYLVYTCDGEGIAHLYQTPSASHKAGEMIEYRDATGKLIASIKQVAHTYATIGFQMNEYQLAIGESTFTGRMELWDKGNFMDYGKLMQLALERAKTAREAIKVITDLVAEYGYGSTGESISIVDKNEAWLLEIIGKGEGVKGAVWVAVRIPDGTVTAHANCARIGEFPLNEPENCIYSKDVISFATEKGYYDSKSGEPFRFNTAYCPADAEKLRYCESRVWSIFRRSAPSLNLSTDYCMGVKGAKRYPLYITPDYKIGLKDVFGLIRDHYEGTELDMTKGVEAGPYGNPNYNRPLTWEYNKIKHCWDRAISTYNSAFTYVAQVRSWLPDAVGGIAWYGVDDSYVTCYMPLYCGITGVPKAFTIGDLKKFSWESAWWVFNFVGNYANLRYSYMIKDIQTVQAEIEDKFIANDAEVIKTLGKLMKKNNKKAIKYLTVYSITQGDYVVARWKELGENLMTKYNDGFIKDDKGAPQQVGYEENWLKRVSESNPGIRKLPQW